jgi:hypothetical protein
MKRLDSNARLRALCTFALVTTVVASACDDATPRGSGDAATSELDARPESHDASSSDAPRSDSACSEPVASAQTPRSVADVVALVNALPRPVTLACFLETLAHPLSLHASRSVLSAQPASGVRSPRIFLFFDPLIASVAPDGVGKHLLELGERRSDTHSLKAELEFPITTELTADAPYSRLRFDDDLGTCDFCHADRAPAPDLAFPYAVISVALRPLARERVAIAQLQAEADSCNAAEEQERCAMLQALFAGAPAIETDFPATYATFVQ